ncbi:MAG TPA: PEP-CTERM sorting domain-containing protein [Bryobacteraceae bacterium]|jgi:hypothetical protein|nr:PEP-CTERM sorting domain-containing protein [Bryobacteraceae bacterium]
MTFRFAMPLLALVSAPGALFATTSYSFGSNTQIAFASGSPAYTAGVWTENYTGGGGTTEQIVCVVGLLSADISNTCGNPGPGSSQHVSIPAQPGNSAILPGGVTNYVEVDGDPTWGAPISATMSGLTIGNQYQISFYQASNEEDGNDKEYLDSWKVYLIPGAGQGAYTPPAGDLVYTTDKMDNKGAQATPWEFESFTFFASAVSETLEFVAHVAAPAGQSITPYQPPFFDLAAVQLDPVPEPGTWALALSGAALLFAGHALRRRAAKRG